MRKEGVFDHRVYQRFCKAFHLSTPSECWPWVGYDNGKGYGLIGAWGRSFQAHRLAYVLFVGPIPDGLHVLHNCDNPRCVNPRHLRVGTHAENMRDMRARGRAAAARKNGQSKLTEPQVRAIREITKRHPPRRGRNGGPCAFLARWFGVSDTAVSAVANGETWRRV